jgi:zinc protease
MDGQAQYLAGWEAEGGLSVGAQYYDTMLSLDAARLQQAMVAHLDPSQVTAVSYRPEGAAPIVESIDALQQLFHDAAPGSAVMAPSAVPTPSIASPAIPEAPAVHLRSALRAAGVIDHGVHVYRTAQQVPVLVMPRPGSPLVNIGVVQRGGASLDEPHHEGLARLAAQTMLKGTATRTGAQIAEATEELGGSIGVSVGLESLGWSLSVPVRHTHTATALLADVLQAPVFQGDAVDTERALALAELDRVRDDMYRWPMRLAAMAAYGTHAYARSVVGTDVTLPMLDAAAVQHFHERHIRRSASVIAVVGDVAPDEIAVLIDSLFGRLEWHEGHPLPEPLWPPVARALHESRAKQQTAMAMLFPGPSRTDAARFAARVLSAIASGLGGRFFEQLRDKQSLAYTVSAFPVERRAAGAFGAYIATSPAREEEARAGLLGEFAKLCDAPPTAEEVERAQRYLIGSHAISQQSGASVLGELVDAWLFGEGLHEVADVPARLAAVTASEIQALAQRCFDPSRVAEGVVRGTA